MIQYSYCWATLFTFLYKKIDYFVCFVRRCMCVLSHFTADFPRCFLTSHFSSALMVFIYPSILQQLSPLINSSFSLSLHHLSISSTHWPPCLWCHVYVTSSCKNTAEMQTCLKNLRFTAPEPASDEPRSDVVDCFISAARLKGGEVREERWYVNEGIKEGKRARKENVEKESVHVEVSCDWNHPSLR